MAARKRDPAAEIAEADEWRRKIIAVKMAELAETPNWKPYVDKIKEMTEALGTPDPARNRKPGEKYMPDLQTQYAVVCIVHDAPPLSDDQIAVIRAALFSGYPNTEAEKRLHDERIEAELARLAGERRQIERAYRNVHGREGGLCGDDVG